MFVIWCLMKLFLIILWFSCCCGRNARAASAQSFTLWQQATIEITRGDHSIIACSRHTYVGVILRAHPVRGESHIQRHANPEVSTMVCEIAMQPLGKMVSQYVDCDVWSIGSFLHPNKSILPFVPVLTITIIRAFPLPWRHCLIRIVDLSTSGEPCLVFTFTAYNNTLHSARISSVYTKKLFWISHTPNFIDIRLANLKKARFLKLVLKKANMATLVKQHPCLMWTLHLCATISFECRFDASRKNLFIKRLTGFHPNSRFLSASYDFAKFSLLHRPVNTEQTLAHYLAFLLFQVLFVPEVNVEETPNEKQLSTSFDGEFSFLAPLSVSPPQNVQKQSVCVEKQKNILCCNSRCRE